MIEVLPVMYGVGMFRPQALEQRRLPDPLFTPVAIVMVKRWMGIGAVMSLIAMVLVWLFFGSLYTTYEISVTMTGRQTSLVLPAEVELAMDALNPTPFIGTCPEIVHGVVQRNTAQKNMLVLEQPLRATCKITLILHEVRPIERLFR